MTLPNVMTVARLPSAILYFSAYVVGSRRVNFHPAMAIVLVALLALIEISDLLDGVVARRTGTVSDLGKLLDPFADSASRLTYFLCFTLFGSMSAWVFVVLLYRDLGVAFARVVSQRNGVVMAARMTGKIKAWFYGFAGVVGTLQICLSWLLNSSRLLSIIGEVATIVFVACAVVAVASLADYLVPVLRAANNRGKG